MRRKKQFNIFLPMLLFLAVLSIVLVNLPKKQETITKAQGGGSVYYGAYLDDFSGLSSFESNAGKAVSLFMLFHSWNEGNFPTGNMDAIRSHGSIPIVSWDSYDPDNADNTSWENIAKGSMDSYITQWALDSKAWGHPYFLRYSWEMNGFWLPYAKQAASFVPMWKHVHDIFTKNGAANTTWVWCPNVEGYSTMPLEQFYPGDSYVDWTCMDGYNFGTSQNWSTWDTFPTLFAPTYNHLLSIAPGKPIMIAEIASSEEGGSKQDWITDMLTTQLPQNFPSVKAFVWFNLEKETNWQIESSDSSKLAFAQAIASSYYASNQFGSIETSPIPYLGSLSARTAIVVTPTSIPPPASTTTPVPTNSPTPTITPSPTSKPENLSTSLTGDLRIRLAITLLSSAVIIIVLLILFKKRSNNSFKNLSKNNK